MLELGRKMSESISEPTSELSEKGKSRRSVLKGVGAAALSIGLFGLNSELIRRQTEQETIIDFSTDGADYRFLGGAHGAINRPDNFNAVTVLRKEGIPDDATFWELEFPIPYLSQEYYPFINRAYTRSSSAPFLQEVVPVLTERQLPLVLADISPVRPDPQFIAELGGTAVLSAVFLGERKDPNLTRRKFLQRGAVTGIGLLAGRTLSNDALAYLHSSAQEPWAQRLAEINHYIELATPESLVTTFRNSLVAAKTLGLEGRLPRNPETGKCKGVLIYGSGHWGIPEYMKSGQRTILDYLSLYPRPFVEGVFGEDNPHLYTSVIIAPEGDGFKIEKVENEGLKALFAAKKST